jgi:hypothetical protein
VGQTLVLPSTALVDRYVKGYTMGYWAMGGAGLILVAFLRLTFEKYLNPGGDAGTGEGGEDVYRYVCTYWEFMLYIL